jgi:hypothetical protein
VVASNNIQPHYTIRPETYVVGVRGDMDGCAYMIIDMGDRRHNDFTDNEEVACVQYWLHKRTPIFFQDTVVVLQWNPVPANPQADKDFAGYCNGFAKELRQRSSSAS